jgi:hypothetical protein
MKSNVFHNIGMDFHISSKDLMGVDATKVLGRF